MTENGHSNRILTVPNAISFVRLVGVGYFWWVLLVAENILLAGILIAVLGGTDWLDGYLARRLNQESELGKVLDPLADRLMIASAVIGGLIAEVVPAVIGWGLITREVFMGVIALALVSKGAGVLEVRWLGKAATLARLRSRTMSSSSCVLASRNVSGLSHSMAQYTGTSLHTSSPSQSASRDIYSECG